MSELWTPEEAKQIKALRGRVAELERLFKLLVIPELLDQDDMLSNSSKHGATQQSIKAYVDDVAQTEEEVQDIVGGMVTGNTETFITVTYEDGDGTLDFVVPVKDEDNMASDDANALATQQSIKAYTDTKMADLSDDTTPTLGGDLDANNKGIKNLEQVDFNGADFPDTSSQTEVDWRESNHQQLDITGNRTLTFTAPDGPCMLSLRIKQDAVGGRTITWPSSVKWPGGTAPTLSTGANDVDVITFRYNGTTEGTYDSLFGLDFG